jgi:phage terminase large subunit-like protein
MSGADRLVPGARHVVVPAGIVSTGWPKVQSTCRNIGWRFDPWQDAAGRLILAKKADGRWAADLSIMSIPRQVGKSYLLGCIIFALCLLNPRLRVIWTSHHTATTEEMFEAMKELAAHKRVAPHVAKCIALQGSRWRIVFRNGSRIDFGARSQGFGRGKARIGVLVLDEFQHISSRALANLVPTTNTAENPLILCAGTPPGPESQGDAFVSRRLAALEGFSDDTLYLEFSADEGADLDDRRQWAVANPSFPKRTPERAFLLLRKVLGDDDFSREALGIWDSDRAASVFSPEKWDQLRDPVEWRSRGLALAVVTNFTRSVTSIVAAGEHDGRRYVEVVEHQPGVRWVTERIRELRDAWQPCAILIDPGSPAGSLLADFEDAGIAVTKMSTQDAKQACGAFYDAVEDLAVRHVGQDVLTIAVRHAQQRVVGDGWLWELRKAQTDVTPLIGATNALWGWTTCHSGDVLQSVW